MISDVTASTTNKLRTLVLDRLLGIERHEYVAVAWSFAYFFCVLSSYYILRPVREAMAVGSGPDTIPYLFIGTFVTMLVATPIFSAGLPPAFHDAHSCPGFTFSSFRIS
jgi:ATP/ADP translocase